jgi:5'-3' exonuclease
MTRTMKTLIDGNSIGFAAHQSGAKLKAGDQETQAVFTSLRVIRSIVQRHQTSQFVVLWDGRSWRKDFYPEYKAQRGATAANRKMRSGYKSQTPFIRRALEALGIPQAISFNMEADDLAAILSSKAAAKGQQVRLITRDRDWQQLVQEGVKWEDHQTNKRVTTKNFEEETGYATREIFCEAKALQGDASDNISGVGGIGEGRAKILFEHWDSVHSFLADNNPSLSAGVKLPKPLLDFHGDEEKHATFARNIKLMDLITIRNLPKPESVQITPGAFDIEAFSQVCKELGFHSYLADLDNFTQPFKTGATDGLIG